MENQNTRDIEGADSTVRHPQGTCGAAGPFCDLGNAVYQVIMTMRRALLSAAGSYLEPELYCQAAQAYRRAGYGMGESLHVT